MPPSLLTLVLRISASLGFALTLFSATADANTSQRLRGLIAQELQLESTGNDAAAAAVCMQILAIAPRDYRTMNTLAGLEGKAGHGREEIRWASAALKVNPAFVPAMINLGNGYVLAGDGDAARAQYLLVVRIAPRAPLAYEALGVLADQQLDFKSAVTWYQKALAINPRFEDALFNLAADYGNLGRLTEARATIHQLLLLEPKQADVQSLSAALDRAVR